MKILVFITALFFTITLYAQKMYNEPYRPQVHFSPTQHWINDPNGMVFYKGVYHLFYQYNPYGSVWGNMHWGHATSTDFIHWKEQPAALAPDSLGMIFSGSAVVDKNNTSGFGTNDQPPLVAIYTQHNEAAKNAGRNDFQNQSIAYSTGNGKTWIKYAHNPVLRNPGISDFRDPKVMWYQPQKKWVMTLAVKDHVSFYSSPDLKSWTKESDFGEAAGAHGGVWECPDLFSLDDNGKPVWILTVSINPGGPNGGSATQYFVGDFDGSTFITQKNNTKWIDYGPDNYAGVTWSNTGNRRIFLGWMSNWLYANDVPTTTWRNAMTLPRALTLVHVDSNVFIASKPAEELHTIEAKPVEIKNIEVDKQLDLSEKTGKISFPCKLDFSLNNVEDFSIVIFNNDNEKLVIGYSKEHNQYFINRTQSGKTNFQKDFAGKYVAPRLSASLNNNISLIIDRSSIELFADDGLTVMTAIFFPVKPYTDIHLLSNEKFTVKKMIYMPLKSIWN